MLKEPTCEEAALPTPRELIVPGPDGATIRFTHPSKSLYARAEIIRPGKLPTRVHFQTTPSSLTLVSGLDAEANNALITTKLRRDTPWSLSLWSIDGHYLLLTIFDVIDGKLDVRNSRSKNAYDTATGALITFANSKAGFLSADSFFQWSPSKPGIALLRTGDHTAEATPNP